MGEEVKSDAETSIVESVDLVEASEIRIDVSGQRSAFTDVLR